MIPSRATRFEQLPAAVQSEYHHVSGNLVSSTKSGGKRVIYGPNQKHSTELS